MLWRIRSAPMVRALLCLGSVLSVCGSLGLHPEPAAFAQARPLASTIEGLTPEQPLASPHICLICILHAPACPSPASSVGNAVQTAPDGVGFVRTAHPARVEVSTPDGRAPPAAL